MSAMKCVTDLAGDVEFLAGVIGLEAVARLLSAVLDGETAEAGRAAMDAADAVTDAGMDRESRERDRYWSMQPGYGSVIR